MNIEPMAGVIMKSSADSHHMTPRSLIVLLAEDAKILSEFANDGDSLHHSTRRDSPGPALAHSSRAPGAAGGRSEALLNAG